MITGAKTDAEAFVDEQQESRLCAQRARDRLMRDSSDECETPITHFSNLQSTGTCEGCNPKDLAGSRKPPLDLIPPVAEVEMAMAFKAGLPYGAWNWREKKITVSFYIAAMKRHIAQFAGCEDYDIESGVRHLGHVMATAAILLDAFAHDCVNDDRVPSNVVELIREYTALPQQGDEVE